MKIAVPQLLRRVKRVSPGPWAGLDDVDLSEELRAVIRAYAVQAEDMMDEGELADLIKALIWSDPHGSEIILELGSFKGNTAALMADLLNRLERDNLVVSVDAFDLVTPDPLNAQGSLQEWIEKNAKWKNRAVCVRGFTADVAKFIRTECAALLIIDASHDYEFVRQDIASYLPVVKRGGVIFVDDYHELNYPGVFRATNEFLLTNKSVEALKVTSYYAVFGKGR